MVTALRDIEKGEELSIKYLPCTLGNTLRRSKISSNWNFDCLCQRCSDPTEFGTYFDALKCQKCPSDSEAHMLPISNQSSSDWKCDKCSQVLSAGPIQTFIKTLQEDAENFRLKEICLNGFLPP